MVGFAADVTAYDAIDPLDAPGPGFEENKPEVAGGANLIDPETGELLAQGDTTPSPIRIPTTAQSMSISQDGTISFVDAAGDLQYAGTIVLAKFANASGLEKTGSNYFQTTPNSGAIYAQLATQDGIGSINSGFMEMSNVDLSEEFTEMIVAQRGFQANSRIITTSDEILQELVNLKR